MTWIVTNGKSGDDAEYIKVTDGGFYWTDRRNEALALARQSDSDSVRVVSLL
jgi:hypothetical protein